MLVTIDLFVGYGSVGHAIRRIEHPEAETQTQEPGKGDVDLCFGYQALPHCFHEGRVDPSAFQVAAVFHSKRC